MTAKKILEDLVKAWMDHEEEEVETKDEKFLTSIAVDTLLYLRGDRKILSDLEDMHK